MAAAHPPAIPVRQTTKSMYRPISKLNGDQLPMLRKVKRPELSGRISLYNQYTTRVLDSTLNVTFKQHEHTMETIRKQQAQIYKSLCRIQKQKRRVQRDEHEQRRQEIRNMFKRQRKRQLMRRVVAKFRENVTKKRAERMIQEANEYVDEYKEPTLSAQQLLKYASGLRRHTQPNVTDDVQEVKVTADNTNGDDAGTTNIHKNPSESCGKTSTGGDAPGSTDKDHHENIPGEQTQRNPSHKQTQKVKKTVKGQSNTKTDRSHSKPDGHLEAIPEVTIKRAISKTQSGKTKSTASANREKTKNSLSSQSLPSISLSTYQDTPHGMSDQTGFTPNTTHSAEWKQSHQGQGHLSHDSLIDQVVRENTFGEENQGDCSGRITHHSMTHEVSEHSPGDEEAEDRELPHRTVSVDPSGVIAPDRSSGKTRGRNMVKVMEKERTDRAKARTRILDEEPFTRYSRKRQEKISAMFGIPKRLEFVPPSGKLRHEQEKLIRREQDKDIQSHINIEKYFKEVFQTKDTEVYRQPTLEEEPPKKATLSLAGVLSQMYTSAEPTPGDKNSMENLRSCQYLRVYNPLLKKVIKERAGGKQESSWDIAERKLRAGFMALSFLK